MEIKEAIGSNLNPTESSSNDESVSKMTEMKTIEFNTLEEFDALTEFNAWVIEVRQEDNLAISEKTWRRLSGFLKGFNIRTGRLLCHEFFE